MAFFEDENDEKQRVRNANYCKNCGRYGRGAFPVSIYLGEGESVQPCHVITCVHCRNIEGIFVYRANGSADFNCREIKLPKGISLEALRRVIVANPMRTTFHIGEILEEMRTLL